MSREQNGAQPVLVLLTEPSPQNTRLEISKESAARRDVVPIRTTAKDHNPSSMIHSHGSDASASCVLQASSEPSGSNRTSLEAVTDLSAPSSATATVASSRKSVSFEEPRPPQLPESQNSRGDGLSSASPFSSYANLASFDEYRRASEEGPASSSGGGGGGSGRSFNKKSNQTEHQCMLGVDSQATSAPMGTLDDASTAAAAAERLLNFRNLNTTTTNSNQQLQTAAQRLRNQSNSISTARNVSSSIDASFAITGVDGGGVEHGSSPPPPAPPPDLLRDFGEAYGAHLVSPRHSIDHSTAASSLSTSSSFHHNHNHSNRNSIGGSSNGLHHSQSNTAINTGPASRSSFDLLLGCPPSAGSTPSRQSLDSLQDLLAAVGAAGGGGGVSRASWESLGGNTPRSSAPHALAGNGNTKVSRRLSAAGHLENARLTMTASSNLSLDPVTEKHIIDSALGNAVSASTVEHRYPSTSELISPAALRALTDSSMSVTVVAAPAKRHAPTAAGPSVGAMASGLIDHYIPTGGESSTPPTRGGGAGGLGSSPIGASGNLQSTMTSTSTAANRSQQQTYTAPGHVAPPALLDADLHDTFGAHAWYCGPAIAPSRTNTAAATSRGGGGGGSYGGYSAAQTAGITSSGGKSSNGGLNYNGTVVGSPGFSKQYSGGLSAAVAVNDSASAFSAAGTVPAGQQQQQQRHLGGNRGTAKHLELTSMPGQHSVTLHDAQCIVPSYEFLRQRRLAIAQQSKEGSDYWSGGYIAEAKRVLNEAMGSASRQEAENRDSSYSGAIGPLLRHLTAAAGDNEKSRSALHTLSLLVSNLPNRSIIAELQGRRTLAAVLRRCTALDVREQAVTLLWDLDSAAGKDAAPAFCAEDLFALIQLLEDTQHAAVASSALHFLDAAMELPPDVGERVELSPEQLTEMATRVVTEVCAHKHRLQDAAQYTLGALLGAILSDPLMTQQAVSKALDSLLSAVRACKDPDQCQVLLTVLSSLAGKPRLLGILAKGTRARDAVLQCGQNAGDQRVKARSLSLIKVLRSKEEGAAAAAAYAVSSSWYFGPGDDDDTTTATTRTTANAILAS